MAQQFQPFPTREAQEAWGKEGREAGVRALIGYFLLWAEKMAALVAESPFVFINGSRALVSDASGLPTESAVTSTEIGYLDGVTSAVQTQLDAKAPIADPTFTGVATAPQYLATLGGAGVVITGSYIRLPVLSAAPASPVNGDIAYADGAGWDPIGGGTPGFVGYEAGAWVKL